MLKKLFPALLVLIGLGAGLGAGLALRPRAETISEDPIPKPAEPAPVDYIKLNNQFIVPVVDQGRVDALVILSINLEVTPGSNTEVYAKEPKIRDALLQVLFDHANSGGFSGVFTDGANLIILRSALKEAVQKVMGTLVSDVLITDIVRQDS